MGQQSPSVEWLIEPTRFYFETDRNGAILKFIKFRLSSLLLSMILGIKVRCRNLRPHGRSTAWFAAKTTSVDHGASMNQRLWFVRCKWYAKDLNFFRSKNTETLLINKKWHNNSNRQYRTYHQGKKPKLSLSNTTLPMMVSWWSNGLKCGA